MREHGEAILRQRVGAGVAAAVVAGLTVGVPTTKAMEAPGGIAPTLSGFPSAPRAERTLRVSESGVGIRFRAPVSGALATVFTHWRRPAMGCALTLTADLDGQPGAPLTAASLPAGAAGWIGVPLSAPLTAGSVYHLVLTCARGSHARIAYVLDADRSAQRVGAWRVEVLHRGRARVRAAASPLFALVFADGRWWGQPYRATGRRAALRVCAEHQASVRLVPSRALVVNDVRVPGDEGGGIDFSLDASDGTTVLATPAPAANARVAPPAAATLSAGAAYTLTLADHGHGRRCVRERSLVTDLAIGPSVAGLDPAGVSESRDGGHTWHPADVTTLAVRLVGGNAPLSGCGNGVLDADEQCDGAADDACPGRCAETCTCRTPEPSPPAGAPTPPAPERTYRSIYAAGYLGLLDPATTPVWPQRLGVMLGEADTTGPLIANARRVAAASGNTDARFIFYLSLTDMDSRCGCFDQGFYDSFVQQHPEWILKDTSGNPVSTSNGIGRLFATDIGNPAYVDAWADWALAAAEHWGWDGTFVDNVFRGYFEGWSATPVDPRTGRPYTTPEYRTDILAAVRHLRRRFDAAGKMLVGNHTQAWQPSTFADPTTQAEVLALGGVEIEDCVYDLAGIPHAETDWVAQLVYLGYANQHGVRTVCHGGGGAIGDPTKRDYLLASYLLTKEALSDVSELNTVGDWWSGLAVDLGAPQGGYACLDPDAGFAPAAACPTTGKIYVRDWERGRVLVNPSADATVTVPLESGFVLAGNPVRSVTLGPHDGVVLERP
jgi:hypothetical protein